MGAGEGKGEGEDEAEDGLAQVIGLLSATLPPNRVWAEVARAQEKCRGGRKGEALSESAMVAAVQVCVCA